MNATPLPPTALWHRTLAVTRHALETGALQPIATEARTLPIANTAFQVRVLGRVALKERKRPAPSQAEPFNPFANPEPDLVLGDVPPAHVCLLNKFNVVEHHLLLVTRAFEPQDALLTRADFDALSTCLEGLDGLAFYNAGETAGASQRHKHLQLVPPLGPDGYRAPVEALLPTLPGPGRVIAAESLPFAHLLAGLG
ncbi:ATP adenylyltransferase, partial [Corallococcus exercitus]|uniref:ATP adenylyltransferase n=1 Tax=Corallococcus exercitus TaxID=2316736 RepID=UPI000EA31F0C